MNMCLSFGTDAQPNYTTNVMHALRRCVALLEPFQMCAID